MNIIKHIDYCKTILFDVRLSIPGTNRIFVKKNILQFTLYSIIMYFSVH